jgi:putative ABC transport system ATP-binding protein
MENNPTISQWSVNVSDVWRTYRLSAHQEVHALRGVNFQVENGRFVALKGRSGSGKTTLLNCVGGLDKPTSGNVTVFGHDLAKMDEKHLTEYHRNQVAFIFQAFSLSPIHSAYENVELILRIAGKSLRECRERALYCIELVGLTKWKGHRPHELSGGQQQRVAIARALANKPGLLLADEPTGKLDTGTSRDILKLFQRIIAEEKITVLMASHDPLVEPYVDYTLRLKDGKLVD